MADVKVVKLGNVYGNYDGMGFGGNVWHKGGLSPCLKTTSAASQQFTIVEVKNERNNSVRKLPTEQPRCK